MNIAKWMIRSAMLGSFAFGLAGCEQPPRPYGTERQMFLPGERRQVWAVAPAVNLSGQKVVDPILQADLVYQQLQQVHGLTVVPVDRVVEVMAGMHVDRIQTADQAAVVCDLLGCDALVIATVTVYDPYDPPKFAGSLQVFNKPQEYVHPEKVNLRELARSPSETAGDPMALPPPDTRFMQAVGMFDAANGTTRDALNDYALGRNDPTGPMGVREYVKNMDRYCGFAYSALAADLLRQLEDRERPKKAT